MCRGTTPKTVVHPGESRGAKLMPVVQHGPRDKPRVALTFDADLTALMRRRLVSGKVHSYYNKALADELRSRMCRQLCS